MRKSVIFLLMISIISSICYGVVAEETHTYKIEGYENTYVDGDFIYDADTGKIIAYAGNGGELIIPENSIVSSSLSLGSKGMYSHSIEGIVKFKKIVISKNVKIERNWFFGGCENLEELEFYNNSEQMTNFILSLDSLENLKKLRLPEGLTQIKPEMCQMCKSLEEVYVPDSVIAIGYDAFYGCSSLEEINLPDSVQEIGKNAFNGCRQLKKINLTSNTEYVGEDAFNGCVNVRSWYIPKSIDYRDIDVYSSVEKVEFEEEPERTKEFYQHFMFTKWMNNEIFPELNTDFLIIDNYLVRYIGDKKTGIIVPDDVEIIGWKAFSGVEIESIKLNNGIKIIEEKAFIKRDNMREIIIPKSVKEIKEDAFTGCTALEKLTFEGDCILHNFAFYGCEGLRDEGIIVKGKLTYKKTKEGEDGDPFSFTDTSYAIERIHIDTTPPPTTPPVSTQSPTELPTQSPKPSESPTVKPTEQPTEKPSEKPTESPTSQPQQTPTPQEKEVIKVVSENNALSIFANEKEIEFTDAKPFIDENGRTQIPIRAVGEALGCEVLWEETERMVRLKKENFIVTITIDSNEMTVGEKELEMDTTAKIIGDRTYIPLRFAGEALGFEVEWVMK